MCEQFSGGGTHPMHRVLSVDPKYITTHAWDRSLCQLLPNAVPKTRHLPQEPTFANRWRGKLCMWGSACDMEVRWAYLIISLDYTNYHFVIFIWTTAFNGRRHRSRKRAKLWIFQINRQHHNRNTSTWTHQRIWTAPAAEEHLKRSHTRNIIKSNWIQLDCARLPELVLEFDNYLTVRLFLHPTRFASQWICVRGRAIRCVTRFCWPSPASPSACPCLCLRRTMQVV